MSDIKISPIGNVVSWL